MGALVSEHDRLVVAFNDTAAPFPSDRTIVDLFLDQVGRTPEALAIRFNDRRLSYRELNARANQVAAHLRALRVGPGDIVCLFMEHSIEVVAAILGTLKVGAAYVPVDPSSPKGRLARILKEIGGGRGDLPVLVTQSRLSADLPTDAGRVFALDEDFLTVDAYSSADEPSDALPSGLAYLIFTSGSTGTPKGVMIEHRNLVNYICWANAQYCGGEALSWPLFSSLAFDLTVTSIFTPLISGGSIVVYREDVGHQSMVVFRVIDDCAVDIVKLTPAHLAMVRDRNLRSTKIRKLIVGGEDFKTELARDITQAFGRTIDIYNEYGPTEATVGCMIHRYDFEDDRAGSVPIGVPAANAQIFVLNEQLQPVAMGVIGEMFIAGDGLARGYLNQPELTAERFLDTADPRNIAGSASLRVYRTGDLARWSADGRLEFLGRVDHQVKVGGARIELGEIEARLLAHPDIRDCAVSIVSSVSTDAKTEVRHCSRCGLASTLPGTTYDDAGVCNICRAYDSYVEQAQAYFKSPEELKALIATIQAERTGDYDCLILLSGGKDSTYMLYQLCALGLKPFVFTLDNGFISEEAKANISMTVRALGVDHMWGTTPHMNAIFVDSLKRFSNVCNGCFKTIYTLATNVAREKKIGYIFTGLSRGQFFETRLTEDVFQEKQFDLGRIDKLVLDARKAYHRRDDAISQLLDVEGFKDDKVFEDIKYVDFFRYWSVPLEEMYAFLNTHASWTRPTDTGRSTNCLINDVGIYLHKKQRGFHNYSLPYSWDVRLDQKTRVEAMEELEDELDESRVKAIMAEIGYVEPPPPDETGINRLVAYYVSDGSPSVADLRAHLAQELPEYMVPPHFVKLDALPLTTNGKVDRRALPTPSSENLQLAHDFVRPNTETEKALAVIWGELLKMENIGINDAFFDLGGHSLLAIRAVSRIRDVFGVDIPLDVMFAKPTIAGLATALDEAKGITGGIARAIEHRDAAGPSPLSFAQEQLWFLDQLSPGNAFYNIVDVVRIDGTFDRDALHRAMKELVRRHEVLRSVFRTDADGHPVQVVQPTVDVTPQEIDLSALTDDARQEAWARTVREQGRIPFSLSDGPLIRATVAHMSARQHHLLLMIHHIVADEWSQDLIQQEVRELYDAFARGLPSPLAPLPVQYADFAAWQRDWLKGDVLDRQIKYWKKELTGAQTVLQLPTDRPRPAVQSFRGATEVFHLPDNLLEGVKTLAREEDATLFMTLQASFMALLRRYSTQDDILVGTPITGRTHSETERLVGYFVNIVVLRGQFSSRLTFRALLQQVRERALGAYAHPDLPLEHVVAELSPDRDPSRTPLFQVMFIVHNPDAVSQTSKVSGNRELQTGTSKFDLTMFLAEEGDRLEGMIEYSTDLFDSATIQRMCRQFGTLLQAIVANPDRRIDDLPLLTAAERQQAIAGVNPTASFESNDCLHTRFERQAALTPDAIAVVCEDVRLTYAELNRRANALAHRLRELGAAPDQLVGLLCERNVDMAVGILGILKSGGAYLPLDPAYPKDRLAFMVEDAGVKLVVAPSHMTEHVDASRVTQVALDGQLSENDSNPTPTSTADHLAYVIYTSGSTGTPKGAQITHRNVVRLFDATDAWYKFNASDVWSLFHSYAFDFSVWELWGALLYGGRVVIVPYWVSRSPEAFRKLLIDERVTVLNQTPSAFRQLIQTDLANTPGQYALRYIVFGGEALELQSLRPWFDRYGDKWPQLVNMYGITETTVHVTYRPISLADLEAGAGSVIGAPIPDLQVYILDANGQPQPIGVPGEMYVGGAGVARGYLNRTQLTSERFVPDRLSGIKNRRLYRTGDLARRLANGDVEYLGRIDTQVKVRGFRIELGEIEAGIARHASVRQVAVTARQEDGDTRLVAFVVADGAGGDLVEQLRAQLRAAMPEYMVPSHFVLLPALPLTSNGKADLRALAKIDISAEARRGDVMAPRTPTETKLAEIWASVLRVDRVGADENFFEIGGHSLLATQVASRIRNAFGVPLQLRELFATPTVAGLAERIDALTAEAGSSQMRETLEL